MERTPALPETAKLLCANSFPCAHDKESLYCVHTAKSCVLPEKHMTQTRHTVNTYFVVCPIAIHIANTRHMTNSPICRVLGPRHTANTGLCRVPGRRHTANTRAAPLAPAPAGRPRPARPPGKPRPHATPPPHRAARHASPRPPFAVGQIGGTRQTREKEKKEE